MASHNTPDLAYKNRPTGESMNNPRLIPKSIPSSATITDRADPQPEPPIGSSGNQFTAQLDCLRELQANRRTDACNENELKREILRQRGLAHSRTVNHNRLVESSDELRALICAANHIAAQKTNVELMAAKERQRLNEGLSELRSGAEFRCDDEVFKVEEDYAERVMRRKQNELKDAYERQLGEKEQRLFNEHLALEEERKHIDKIVREEAQNRLDAAKRRMLEQERWQGVIRDFQAQRLASKEKAADDLRRENEKIASHNEEQAARSDGQKALRAAREERAERLRNRLVADMKSKENAVLEKEQILADLRAAEEDEKEFERKRQLKIKKKNEHEELRDAVKESRACHQLREEKKKRDWTEYQDVLRQQGLAMNHQMREEAQLRQDRQAAVTALLDQQRADHRNRTILDKRKEAEWAAKEDEDSRLWREFVDAEREKYLRSRTPELTSYLKGFHRFPLKKDDDLFQTIQEQAENGDLQASPLVNRDQPPLTNITPQSGTTHEVFRNLQEARLSEIYGIGSR
ncbi:hypothetical protein BV898_07750 [Hypsibius exemplaris]|uniref:Meiosis-specific nuclear structural protein 1 n=1 Tax=Hypsibius exemplaris TaxID=2072580 RepID=A0A1W0WSJ6_HYPEX|nr:hypothetical protein BV898_07750 [Hypsibius exemplaris]